jgi:hypothetical protein
MVPSEPESAVGRLDQRGLVGELIADGRPPLAFTAVGLLLSGAFAIFLATRREFLPHDVAFLGMTAASLCEIAECRVVRFMFHDRVAFGGTLVAVGILYLWLVVFPLRERARGAWRAFVVSGLIGFGSFLTYIGYGYLDSWHSAATLTLLPAFLCGIWRSRPLAQIPARGWLVTDGRLAPSSVRFGRYGLLATGAGLILAGLVISYIGVTDVFVREDLAFIGVTRESLDSVNARLVPLIAHDRSGFGGGLTTIGVLFLTCGWYARPSRSFSSSRTACRRRGLYMRHRHALRGGIPESAPSCTRDGRRRAVRVQHRRRIDRLRPVDANAPSGAVAIVLHHSRTSRRTRVRPCRTNPRRSAAPRDTSRMTPCFCCGEAGPRSRTRTSTERPLARFVTRRRVPNG